MQVFFLGENSLDALNESFCSSVNIVLPFTLLHSEQPKLHQVISVFSSVGLRG